MLGVGCVFDCLSKAPLQCAIGMSMATRIVYM